MSENSDIKKVENQPEIPFEQKLKEIVGPAPPEVEDFLTRTRQAVEYQNKLNRAAKLVAINGIGKFREATRIYLEAIRDMRLPECYAVAIVNYIGNLDFLWDKSLMGKCLTCDFKVAIMNPIFTRPEEAQQPAAQQTPQQPGPLDALPDAEAEKKINLYDTVQDEEKAAETRKKREAYYSSKGEKSAAQVTETVEEHQEKKNQIEALLQEAQAAINSFPGCV
jgi:hypothetical protein